MAENRIKEIVADVAKKDRATGWIVSQIYSCSLEEKWYPAIASLFMLLEQVLRFKTGSGINDSLCTVIKNARKSGLIDETEENVLHEIRGYRNAYLHSNFYENTFEIAGLLYPVNDEGTAEVVFNKIWAPCLKIIQRLTACT